MKKFLFPLACTLMIIGTSCDDNPDQPANTQQIKGTLPTCIIPADENQPVILSESPSYAFTVHNYTGLWTVGVSNINVQGLGSLDFVSPEIAAPGSFNRYITFNSRFSAKNGETISGLKALLCTDYHYYTGETTVVNLPLGTMVSVSFSVPDKYDVRAFPKTAYFGGNMTSTYAGTDGNEKHYTSTTMQIGVDIDIASRVATIIMTNARFAEEMPVSLSRLELKGLSVEGDHEHGYVIKGKNVIPVVGEGQGATPYPNFTFDEIEFYPTNELMYEAECEFEVANRYKGEFTGSYVR